MHAYKSQVSLREKRFLFLFSPSSPIAAELPKVCFEISYVDRQFASANLGQTWNIQPSTGRYEDNILDSCEPYEIIRMIKSKIYVHPFIILNFESYLRYKFSQNWGLVSACTGLKVWCLSEVFRCKLPMRCCNQRHLHTPTPRNSTAIAFLQIEAWELSAVSIWSQKMAHA